MTLRALTMADMEIIRRERNKLHGKGILRTSYMLTEEMQRRWFAEQIDDRQSTTRYWALLDEDGAFIGYGGIEHIEWENGCGELSLLIFEGSRGRRHGRQAVYIFLEQAFNHLRLPTVYAEVYECNPNRVFWDTVRLRKPTYLPRRKFHDGRLYGSYYYVWEADDAPILRAASHAVRGDDRESGDRLDAQLEAERPIRQT